MKRTLLLFFWILASVISGFCQEKSKIKFGNVSPEDFAPTAYAVDSNASAVIIADIGSTEIIGNNKGSFSLLFKNYRRARIMNKNGYEISDVVIDLYANGDDEEQLESLKAVTYNLENGKVVETKLEVKAQVFKDKISENLVRKKFTFPNIKEGSIIEYEYRIKSDFVFNLQPWDFQGEYPRLWSEYNVAMPEFYNYVTLSQGYNRYEINDRKDRRDNFNMAEVRGTERSDRATFSANVTDYRWVMKNVPILKIESFTSTLRNHISRIEFQLQSIREPFPYRMVMGTWDGVAKRLLESEDFGLQIKKDNGWLGDATSEAIKNAKTPIDKARFIYSWVRDNFTCTSHSRMYLDQSLKNVLKSRKGSVAEINLLLTAMLTKAGLSADPILLSTRSHGYTHSMYPLLGRFNYVISAVNIDNQSFFLDASEPRMGFAKLDYKCYNGHARIINSSATAIDMNAETLQENKRTTVFIVTDEKGKTIGTTQQLPGYYESHRLRNLINEKGVTQLEKNILSDLGSDIVITDTRIDSLELFDEPLGITYDFEFNTGNEDILYVNPMFGEGYKENPFKAAERFYPVEMPYSMDQVFNLQMEVPKGYVLEELPKQTVVKFNEEGDATFEYRISESNGSISLRSRVMLKRAFFAPEEYETLREFFNMIVTKHNEQIVFKKKK